MPKGIALLTEARAVGETKILDDLVCWKEQETTHPWDSWSVAAQIVKLAMKEIKFFKQRNASQAWISRYGLIIPAVTGMCRWRSPHLKTFWWVLNRDGSRVPVRSRIHPGWSNAGTAGQSVSSILTLKFFSSDDLIYSLFYVLCLFRVLYRSFTPNYLFVTNDPRSELQQLSIKIFNWKLRCEYG